MRLVLGLVQFIHIGTRINWPQPLTRCTMVAKASQPGLARRLRARFEKRSTAMAMPKDFIDTNDFTKEQILAIEDLGLAPPAPAYRSRPR